MSCKLSRLCLALTMGATLGTAGQAAEIASGKISSGLTGLAISGFIEFGDENKFEAVAARADEFSSGQTIVVLSSEGGNVASALAIGAYIRTHGFYTIVMPGIICASACGYIWLAGSKRFLSESARVGFHAAYSAINGEAVGMGNALIGAYLRDLNLPIKAIAWMTSADASAMQWLHQADAIRLDIPLTVLPDDKPQSTSVAAKPDSPSQGAAEHAGDPGYSDGRQARLDWETWFNGLPPGDIRDGAEWLASNRKNHSKCNQPGHTASWQQGCGAARTRLLTVDARRNTEAGYWWGWNSL